MTTDQSTPLELLTVGRICVDLYAEQIAVHLNEVRSFRKSVGGTATNVAVAAARLGHHAAVFTRLGDDPMGEYVRTALAHTFHVNTSWIATDPTLRTPLAFATMQDPGEPEIIFYREPKAPDMNIIADDIDPQIVRQVPILWFPTSCLSADPSRRTIHQLLEWRQRRTHTVLDLDWRPQFWGDPSDATTELAKVLPHVTMVIGNRAECRIAVGESDPHRAADALLALGLHAAVVKMGSQGVLVATADGMREEIGPHHVEVLCGLGAGDAFGGAFCHGLLSGWDLARCARAGNVAGALVAARLMCADDMPYLEEIDAVLG